MLTSPFRSPTCSLRGRRCRSSILLIDSPDSFPRPPLFPLIVLFESLPVVFMGGSELVLDLVEVRVDARRLGQEIVMTLGIRFGRPRLDEGEPGLCSFFFVGCSVLCVAYNIEAGD